MAQYHKNSPICISDMTGKLKGLRAINTSPLVNPYCQKMSKNPNTICHQCYSILMLLTTRQNAHPAYVRNTHYLADSIIPEPNILHLNDDIFRFNAHGELVNVNHAINLLNVARVNPNTIIGFWTKRPDLIRKAGQVPANVNLIYSTPKVNILQPKVPEGFHKVFSAYTKEFAEKHNIKINCHGGCNTCRLCYTKNKVTHINEVIKKEANKGIYLSQR